MLGPCLYLCAMLPTLHTASLKIVPLVPPPLHSRMKWPSAKDWLLCPGHVAHTLSWINYVLVTSHTHTHTHEWRLTTFYTYKLTVWDRGFLQQFIVLQLTKRLPNLQKPKFHHRDHKILLLDNFHSQFNSLYSLATYFFKININIIFLRLGNVLFLRVPNQNSVRILQSHM
jgi:hypothetical protein